MRIAGFDPGLKTGWAVYDSLLSPHWWWGVFDLSYDKPLACLMDKLKLIAHPHEVWVEKPLGMGFYPMSSNSQKLGIIALWAGEEIVRTIAPTSIKKFATGSGRARKNEMIAAARTKWGVKVHADHEADALWICEYGRSKGGW